jgi:hypothetical protein
MNKIRKSIPCVLFLFLFFALTVSINFLHTEKTAKDIASCPACQFLSSSLAVQTIHFFVPPEIHYLGIINAAEFRVRASGVFVACSPRSPPAV